MSDDDDTTKLPDAVARAAETHRPDHVPERDLPLPPDKVAELEAHLAELTDDERRPIDRWLDEVVRHGKGGHLRVVTATETTTTSTDSTTPGGPLAGKLIRGADILSVPQPPWLVDSVVPGATVTTILGQPGSAKTFIALDLALAVLTGRRWGGYPTNADPTRGVLWLAGEGVTELGRRARAWAAHHDHDPTELLARFDVLPGGLSLTNDDHARALLQLVAELDPQLVVIDTWARHIVGVEENSSKETGLAVDVLERVAALDVAVVVLHHTGKGGARGGRGSEALQGAVRSELTLEKSPGYVKVNHTKANNGAEVDGWWCDLVPAGTDPETGGHLSLVPVPRAGRPPANTEVANLLVDLLGRLDYGDGVRYTQWREAADELNVKRTMFDETIKQLKDAGRVVKGSKRNDPWRVADDDPDELEAPDLF